MTSLPDELVVDIIARVPRRYYPTISMVSKRFRSIVASSELYARRSLLGCTEHCLYALFYNRDTDERRLYTLKSNGSFVLVPSLPPMPSFASFVAVGSKIYVVGGIVKSTSGLTVTSRAFTIDCRFHAVQPIPDIPKPVADMVAEIIDGKIYVIGSYDSEVMVFNTKTQTWELGMTNPKLNLKCLLWGGSVAMADKIYFRDCENSFVYSVTESKWETDSMLNSNKWYYACVHDDLLYYYDNHKYELRGYDTKQKCWIVVKGVGRLLPDQSSWSYTVSYSEKLLVFLCSKATEERGPMTWCVGIALERRQGGEIWGKVECCDVVTDGRSFVVNSVTIMV